MAKTAADILALADAWVDQCRTKTPSTEVLDPVVAEPVRTDADTASATALLTVQAQDLDRLFVGLTARAGRCPDIRQAELLLRLALKAQNQCRATLATTSELKQPRIVAFVGSHSDDTI